MLETSGIVIRKVFDTNPPTVEYSLTTQGSELAELMDSINKWTHNFACKKDIPETNSTGRNI